MYNSGTNTVIQPLQSNFKGRGKVKGCSFALLGIADKAFLYEVSYGKCKYYEVFYKKVNKRFACVSYPTSKSFGIWAWTFEDIKSAIQKFNSLNYN